MFYNPWPPHSRCAWYSARSIGLCVIWVCNNPIRVLSFSLALPNMRTEQTWLSRWNCPSSRQRAIPIRSSCRQWASMTRWQLSGSLLSAGATGPVSHSRQGLFTWYMTYHYTKQTCLCSGPHQSLSPELTYLIYDLPLYRAGGIGYIYEIVAAFSGSLNELARSLYCTRQSWFLQSLFHILIHSAPIFNKRRWK